VGACASISDYLALMQLLFLIGNGKLVMDRDASGLELEGAWAHIHMLQARALSLLLS